MIISSIAISQFKLVITTNSSFFAKKTKNNFSTVTWVKTLELNHKDINFYLLKGIFPRKDEPSSWIILFNFAPPLKCPEINLPKSSLRCKIIKLSTLSVLKYTIVSQPYTRIFEWLIQINQQYTFYLGYFYWALHRAFQHVIGNIISLL